MATEALMTADQRRAVDYVISPADAKYLLGAVLLPADLRRQALDRFRLLRGTEALVGLFAHFIGLANSVIANNREMIETEAAASGLVHPERTHQINLPTLFGGLNGIVLAEAIEPSALCHGCAFRLGTPANQSPSTTCDAELCSEPGEATFMCHEDMDERGQPTKGCRGFAQARAKRKV